MLIKVTRLLLQLGLLTFAPIVVEDTKSAVAQGPALPIEQSPIAPPVAAPAEAPTATITICRYDPNSGVPNVLGMRTYVSLTESEGNTVVTLDRFPSFVSSAESPNRRAEVAEVRSLTLYDTSIAAARQVLVEQPAYYAALMEIDEADIGAGFAPVNETLGCGQVAAAPMPAESTPEETIESPNAGASGPAATTAVTTMETVGINLPMLPNGNYRFVSANFPNRAVSAAELTESGSAIFLFRKFGENITGTFGYAGQENNVCISGTVDGNTVVGTAYRRGSELQENTFLILGEEVKAAEYAESALNLDGFSRINAGNRLPLESCS